MMKIKEAEEVAYMYEMRKKTTKEKMKKKRREKQRLPIRLIMKGKYEPYERSVHNQMNLLFSRPASKVL